MEMTIRMNRTEIIDFIQQNDVFAVFVQTLGEVRYIKVDAKDFIIWVAAYERDVVYETMPYSGNKILWVDSVRYW